MSKTAKTTEPAEAPAAPAPAAPAPAEAAPPVPLPKRGGCWVQLPDGTLVPESEATPAAKE